MVRDATARDEMRLTERENVWDDNLTWLPSFLCDLLRLKKSAGRDLKWEIGLLAPRSVPATCMEIPINLNGKFLAPRDQPSGQLSAMTEKVS